jgi:hypothetical protein
MRVAQGFAAQNVVAIYDEPNTTGDFRSFDAPRNAPAKNPVAHLPQLYWHSEFFQYELAMNPIVTTVNHTALAGQVRYDGIGPNGPFNNATSAPTGNGGVTTPAGGVIYVQKNGQVRTTDIVLYTHNLGYVPVFFIASQGKVLLPGLTIQTLSEGRGRLVHAFATSSIIGLRETATSSQSSLPAISRSYELLICRIPTAQSGRPLMGMEGNNLVIAKGKVDTSKRYIRRVLPGESSFAIDRGRTGDVRGGRLRQATGGTLITEPGYAGSFAAPSYIAIGV